MFYDIHQTHSYTIMTVYERYQEHVKKIETEYIRMETSATNSLGQNISNIQNSISSGIQTFSSNNTINAGKDFLEANSMIAKFVFILFVMILFVIAFQLGLAFITYLFTPSRNPTLVNGVRGGSSKKTISQDPKVSTNQVILRSNDQAGGIEYTWSVWLRVDDIRNETVTGADRAYSHVFHKGNEDRIVASSNNGDIATVNNSPGLYLRADNTNKEYNAMTFIQDVVGPVDGTVPGYTQVDVSNIPMKKWFHSAFRLQNKTLDVYINGQIVSRNAMTYMPKQNYDDIFVGGFPGSISDLKYFDRALTIFEINGIVNQGPNLTTNDDNSGDVGQYDYLSRLWYNV